VACTYPSWLPSLHCRVFPEEEVTSVDAESEVDPREAALTHSDVATMWQSVVRLYKTGLHPAVAVCVRRQGKIVLHRAIGHLRGNTPDGCNKNELIPIHHSSLFNVFSASKSVTAMVVHLLDQRGLVHLDDSIVEYLPEFGSHGKDGITLRQILTHRAGIPSVDNVEIDVGILSDQERIMGLLRDAKPYSVPGRRLAYHAMTGGFVIAEVVKRVTGMGIREYLQKEILDPLGFKSFNYGVPTELASKVAFNCFTGLPPVPPASWLLKRALGVSVREGALLSNSLPFVTSVIPSGNVIGTAEEGSRFFQMLLNEGQLNGVRIFQPRTVRRAVAEQSFLEIDSFLGLPVRYGMGFMLGGDTFSLYGSKSGRAFGHIGFTNVMLYADPDRDISVCLMTSGKPLMTPGQLFWLNISRTIARQCTHLKPPKTR
jgi:CubicO group peptidase (beta-lactamase class C family)